MSQYPAFSAGQRVTAALLQSMQPVYIIKAATTARLNTVTPTPDPDLTYNLAANATYFIEFDIKYAAAAVAGTTSAVVGFRTSWAVPTGAGGLRTSLGPGASATDGTAQDDTMHSGVHGYNSVTLIYGGRSTSSTNQLSLRETAVLTTTSGGACAFQWSQTTASTTYAASVFGGSFMRITQLA